MAKLTWFAKSFFFFFLKKSFESAGAGQNVKNIIFAESSYFSSIYFIQQHFLVTAFLTAKSFFTSALQG